MKDRLVLLGERSKVSRKAAIHKFCLECVGVDGTTEGGSWMDVRNCTATDCALYQWRPGQEKVS